MIVNGFGKHGMLNLNSKAFGLIARKVRLRICNVFGAAFTNAFINLRDNKALLDEYVQKFKKICFKKW